MSLRATSRSVSLFHVCLVVNLQESLRVEGLATTSSVDTTVDFSSLRESISALQKASSKLDKEKVKAGHELEILLLEWRHRRATRRKLWRAWCKIRRALGKDCHRHHKDGDHRHHGHPSAEAVSLHRGETTVEFKPRIGRLPGVMREKLGHKCGLQSKEPHHPHKGPFSSHTLSHAIKRVQAVNKKLSTFEQGFISEGGIKDREWYRHLGVAPGKWLGECFGVLDGTRGLLTIYRLWSDYVPGFD